MISMPQFQVRTSLGFTTERGLKQKNGIVKHYCEEVSLGFTDDLGLA